MFEFHCHDEELNHKILWMDYLLYMIKVFTHNIIQIHNNFCGIEKYSTEYFNIHIEYREYFMD